MSKYIDYDFENCSCSCDNKYCGTEEMVDGTDYREINEELKDYGWKIINIDGQWLEFCCLYCLNKYKEYHEKEKEA